MDAAKRAKAEAKFAGVVDRLVHKMQLSQAPVPGFLIGLSGTDSVVAFLALHDACRRLGKADRLLGIHYVDAGRRKPTWFASDVVPWLTAMCPEATILVETPLGGNQDPQRWADLHLRSNMAVSMDADGAKRFSPLPEGGNYWVAGTINASEHALGRHTLLAAAVSIQPIRSMWKTDVLAICESQGVPAVATENARIPDCLCGRDEIAAENIDLIDDLLRYTARPEEHDPTTFSAMMDWVADQKRTNGFRSRVPYLP